MEKERRPGYGVFAPDVEEEPFLGFSEKDLGVLYPIVDTKSRKLFLVVEKLREKYMHDFADTLSTTDEPVVIDKKKLAGTGGSDILIEKIRYEGDTVEGVEEEETFASIADVIKMAEQNTENLGDGEGAGTSNRDSRKNLPSFFPEDELDLLRKPMIEGWTRDVVLKSANGSGAGEVNYTSPYGFTVRCFKDLVTQLAKVPCKGLTRYNFSFTAQPIGGTKNEIIKYTDQLGKTMEKTTEAFELGPMNNFSNSRSQQLKLNTLGEKTVGNVRGNGPSPPKRVGGYENNVHPEKKSRSESKHGYVMGTLPPNFPKACLTNSAEDILNDVKIPRRRGRPVTKKEKDRPIESAESDEGMFQISALTKLFAGMEQSELDNYNRMANIMAAQQSVLDKMDPTGSFMEDQSQSDDDENPNDNDGYSTLMNTLGDMMGAGEMETRDNIKPCSIRCAGMTGEIPSLQCTRCLCLYHPECLGFPPNLNTTSFICSDCDGISTGGAKSANASPDRPLKKELAMPNFLQKMMGLKRPPGLQPMAGISKSGFRSVKHRPGRPTGFHPIGKGGMSVRRLDGSGSSRSQPGEGGFMSSVPGRGHGMSIAPVNMKRGRGRGRGGTGRIPIPPQLSRNLTITPISIPIKGQLPKVPNLNPINGAARSSCTASGQMFNNSLRGRNRLGGRGGRMNLPALIPASYSGTQPAGPSSSAVSDDKPNRPRYPMPNFGAAFRPVKPPPPNMFRRFPQSVVTVGQKKFIAIPSAPAGFLQTQLRRSSVIAQAESGPFGKKSEVIKQVFNFLTSKDLINASVVSKLWNTEAKKQWRIVRLKNTRIYGIESFIEYITARGTEVIDFRKMLGSIVWADLFTLMNNVPTLQSVILGPRSAEIITMLHDRCPNIRLIQN